MSLPWRCGLLTWPSTGEPRVPVQPDGTIVVPLLKNPVAASGKTIQNLRKDKGLEVLDKISIEVERNGHEDVITALMDYKEYISNETQALSMELKDKLADGTEVDMDDFRLKVEISKK